MALVSCAECGKPVAHKAEQCPHCGEPDPSRRARNTSIRNRLFGLVIVLAAGSYLWFVTLPSLKNFPNNNISQH
jgi:RNA polymerase subunit RPABC4/transcription elongation factor Spt4